MPNDPVEMGDGEFFQQDENGKWHKVAAPLTKTGATAPLVPGKDFELPTSTRIQRKVRDAQLPVPSQVFELGVPPYAIYNQVSSALRGENPSKLIPLDIGTGGVRDALTGIGGAVGAGIGAGATRSIPGAAAGYTGGSAIGSGLGQTLEALLPNLFQSGYMPEQNEGQTATSPGIENTLKDVAINAATDALTLGAAKGAPLLKKATRAKAKEELIKNWLTRKYRPTDKSPGLVSPIDEETVEAINANPDVPIDVGQVMGQSHWTKNVQELLRPQESISKSKREVDVLFRKADELKNTTSKSNGFAAPGGANENTIGKAGFDSAAQFEKNLIDTERKSYVQVNNFAKKTASQGPPTISTVPGVLDASGKPATTVTPGKVTEHVGPVKLTGLSSNASVQVNELGKIISELGDSPLTAELKIVRGLYKDLGDGKVKDFATVREAEKALNDLIYDKNITPKLSARLTEMRSDLVNDIEKNLAGGVKETAGGWKPGALEAYKKAKAYTQSRFDTFNADVRKRMAATAGEDISRPGARGGTWSKMFDTVLDSPQEAKRLSAAAGQDITKVAFLDKFLNKHTTKTTKMINGKAALEELADEAKTGGAASALLNRDEKQKVKHLLKLYAQVDDKISPVGQMAMEMRGANSALQIPGDALRAATTGGKAIRLGPAMWFVGKIGGDKFAENYLLNDKFARQVVNLIGKKRERPGMSKEMLNLLKTIQGVKMTVRIGNTDYLWNTGENKLTEIPK